MRNEDFRRVMFRSFFIIFKWYKVYIYMCSIYINIRIHRIYIYTLSQQYINGTAAQIPIVFFKMLGNSIRLQCLPFRNRRERRLLGKLQVVLKVDMDLGYHFETKPMANEEITHPCKPCDGRNPKQPPGIKQKMYMMG